MTPIDLPLLDSGVPKQSDRSTFNSGSNDLGLLSNPDLSLKTLPDHSQMRMPGSDVSGLVTRDRIIGVKPWQQQSDSQLCAALQLIQERAKTATAQLEQTEDRIIGLGDTTVTHGNQIGNAMQVGNQIRVALEHRSVSGTHPLGVSIRHHGGNPLDLNLTYSRGQGQRLIRASQDAIEHGPWRGSGWVRD